MIDLIESLGYLGIFLMTLVEGSFIPIPSEITIIPAGYLVAKGKFTLINVMFWSLSGTIAGVFISYFTAYYFGRNLLMRYGKYIFIDSSKLSKIEAFFMKHGHISVFIGRILPGLKHFISFPAGLARMDIKLFSIYSICGATLWVSILVFIGYSIGDNEELVAKYIKRINYVAITLVILLIAIYSYLRRERNER